MSSLFLLLLVVLINCEADCFSTPGRSASKGLDSKGRSLSLSLSAADSRQYPTRPVSYTRNYITAIEDQDSNGFFVASTDHNYAISAPSLTSRQNWLSVSVNGDNVFIIRLDNSTKLVKLASLSLLERDFLAEVRGKFTQNLAGLEFAYYTSGSSLSLNIGSPLSLLNTNGQEVAAIISPPFRANEDPNYQARGRSFGSTMAKALEMGDKNVISSRASTAPSKRSAGAGPLAYGDCRASTASDTNYYNLINSPLNSSLAGDIYYFDFNCNILDVYSSTVSVRRHSDISVLYRDYRFFSFSSANMPLSINRFFLIDDVTIFVYNDGTMVIKQGWMLQSKELDLVVRARQILRSLATWQLRASALQSKANASINLDVTSLDDGLVQPVIKKVSLNNRLNNLVLDQI